MRIYFVHWNESEARERTEELIAAGHEVRAHWSSEQEYKWGEYLPDVVVISLDRLPSHGRAVAEWVWEAKKRQHIPIVFVGGASDKVKTIREKFPNATFCSWPAMIGVVGKLT
ncbi:MAG: hypothetical protein L0241_20645 [Planctomycetia bacterium]|nr:hypothetical protein [Planctomycetia bacterium]